MKRAAATAQARSTHAAPELSPVNGIRGCSGKRQYPDYTNAAKVAKTLNRRTETRAEPYRCMHCRCWHIGTADPDAKRKRLLALDNRSLVNKLSTD